MTPYFELDQLTKIYEPNHQALDSVSFSVERQEKVILLGANGSGKSTLLRCCNGLETPSAGRVLLEGIDLSTLRGNPLRQQRRKIGMVFQDFRLVEELSVFQNVLFGSVGRLGWRSFHIVTPVPERKRAMECLAAVDLAPRAHAQAGSLSGGQKQRLAIARMLMQNPDLVLADEPVASLDPKAARDVMDLLCQIVQEQGMTLICSLHQLDLARTYGERIVALKDGRKIFDQSVSDFSAKDAAFLYQGTASEQQVAA